MKKISVIVFALLVGFLPAMCQAQEKAETKEDTGGADDQPKVDRSKNVIFGGKEAGKGKAVRLFILSGQSNMAALDHKLTFIPAIEKAFPEDELIFVKDAQSGQPIRRWAANWKPAGDWQGKNNRDKPGNNDIYKRLMESVKATIKDKKIDTMSFAWMQGEADAKSGQSSNYEEALKGLIKQLRDDLGRQDLTAVIGRISDHMNGDKDWDAVRLAQVKVAEDDPLVEWVDSDEFNGTLNGLHCDGKGYMELGKQFAEKLIGLLNNQKK